jgi:S1-C subfamily serine protease
MLAAAMGAGAGTGAGQAAELPELITSIRPSVLPVGTFSATDSPRFGFRGTGFVVGDGRLVATNAHVVPEGAGSDGGPAMAVVTGRGATDGPVRRARVVAIDRGRDLALLQFDAPALPALPLNEGGLAREGQAIALLGFPLGGTFGYALVTHHGIVASITSVALPAPSARQLDPRALIKLRDGNFEIYQLDATAYPGNSGGPVIDAQTGVVIGIVNMVLVKGSRESALSSPTGISYAIPIGNLIELMRSR